MNALSWGAEAQIKNNKLHLQAVWLEFCLWIRASGGLQAKLRRPLPIEAYEPLAYVVVFLFVGAVGLVRARREKRRLLGRDDKLARLEEWAKGNGWRAYESIDLRYAEQIDRLTGLAGKFDASEQFVPLLVWQHAVVLVSGPPEAQFIACDCWREGRVGEFVISGLKVAPRFSAPSTVLWTSGKLEAEDAALSDEELIGLFKPLEWAYLRCIDDMIILVTLAPLSGPIVKTLATILSDIRTALPSVPRRL